MAGFLKSEEKSKRTSQGQRPPSPRNLHGKILRPGTVRMKLRKGAMLDFIGLGTGLLVKVTILHESKLGANSVPPANRMILTNRYECDVLVEGIVYSMPIVVHYWPNQEEGSEDYSRIEWQVKGQDMWAKSGLAEVMWHSAKFI